MDVDPSPRDGSLEDGNFNSARALIQKDSGREGDNGVRESMYTTRPVNVRFGNELEEDSELDSVT